MRRINYLLIISFGLSFFAFNSAFGQVLFDKEPHKRSLEISKSLKDSLCVNPKIFLPLIVEKLTYGVTDDFEKVKIIHDWIATEIRYDTEPYLRYSDLITETYEVIREKRGICVGYCNLFDKMCSYANIESVSISGVAKPNYITEKFLPVKYTTSNHMWSAAKIKERWYLIDVTWDAGYSVKGDFFFKYSTTYLFQDPQIFITHHFPKDEKWQLLNQPVSWDKFRTLEFEEPTDKLSLNNTIIKGGISFSRLYNLNIPDITETKGFNISFSRSKGITNELGMEVELSFDHMNINQDYSLVMQSPYFTNQSKIYTDPVTHESAELGNFSFDQIGVGLNLKYHFQNETVLLPFLKTGFSISTPFTFGSGDNGMIVMSTRANREPYNGLRKVKSLSPFDQMLYGVLISTGADLVRKEDLKNEFFPVLGIEFKWSFLLNSMRLFENYNEGQNHLKSYAINLIFYL